MPRKGRRRRSVPTPTPRTAPLVAATALAGALGCGPRQDRPLPPQAQDPYPYDQPPQVVEEPDAGADFAEPPPGDPVPPQVPPQVVPPEEPPQAPQVAPPPQPPVLPERPKPPQPKPQERVMDAPVMPDEYAAPPPLVSPFDSIE
jgi:protein TonB